jgi:hypothetical protein
MAAATSADPSSAQHVVSAYLAALDAHDIARAKTYLTPAHAAEVAGETDSWFINTKSITNIVIGCDTPRDAVGGPASSYSQVVQVGVQFTLEQYHAESMSNGPNDWSYILVRNSDRDPWLIEDEGMGEQLPSPRAPRLCVLQFTRGVAIAVGIPAIARRAVTMLPRLAPSAGPPWSYDCGPMR